MHREVQDSPRVTKQSEGIPSLLLPAWSDFSWVSTCAYSKMLPTSSKSFFDVLYVENVAQVAFSGSGLVILTLIMSFFPYCKSNACLW